MERRTLLKSGLMSLGLLVKTPEIKHEYKLRKVDTNECLDKGGIRPFKKIWLGKRIACNPGVECLFCGSRYPTTNRHGPCPNCGVYY